MLRQADEHIKIVVPVFHIAESQLSVQLRPSQYRVRHSDTVPGYGRASEARTLRKIAQPA